MSAASTVKRTFVTAGLGLLPGLAVTRFFVSSLAEVHSWYGRLDPVAEWPRESLEEVALGLAASLLPGVLCVLLLASTRHGDGILCSAWIRRRPRTPLGGSWAYPSIAAHLRETGAFLPALAALTFKGRLPADPIREQLLAFLCGAAWIALWLASLLAFQWMRDVTLPPLPIEMAGH